MFETLEEYTKWIKESLPGIRKKEVKILNTINPVELAYKATIALKPGVTGFVSLTAVCGKIGLLVLMGIENPKSNEEVLNLTRFKVGWHLLNVLFCKGKLRMKRGDKDRDPYIIQVEKAEAGWVDELFRIVDEEPLDIPVYCRPTFEKPKPFTDFNHEVAGELVRGIDKDKSFEFKMSKRPLVYDAINKHMGVSYVANMRLLSIYYKSLEDDIFTLAHKDLTDEQREGIEREMTTTMQIAKGTRGRKFWQYMFYDSRGRLYSSAAYFMHQGSKLSKSLFTYSHEREITKEGWFWLMVHLANTYGFDKATIDNRAEFAEANLKEWMLIAANPIRNKKWQHVDDPFNFLAAILVVKEAIDSGDKYSYKTGLPIAWDATCSGLQILSLLSRDEKSGKECNLADTEVRGDYYKMIANKVWEECVYTDEEFESYHDTLVKFTEGIDETNRQIKLAKGKKEKKAAIEVRKKYTVDNEEIIDKLSRVFWGREDIAATARNLAKRPCMTFFYSCGARTMSKALYKDHKSNKLYAGIKPFLCYWLCSRIYDACETEMPIASQFMKLMIEVGKSEYEKGKDLTLEMPFTKFLLMQRYRDNIVKLVKVKYKNKKDLRLRVIIGKGKRLDYRKIINASSPNWVHGLDGQVVMHVLLHADYIVTSIHDSFSTHPSDAGKLYEDTRRSLHSVLYRDLIYDMLKQKEYEWNGQLGDLDSDELLDNQYCFS